MGRWKGTRGEGAAYTHRKRKLLFTETKARMERIQEDTNPNSATRPLSVVVLTVDSLSRKQFYRKLPKTRDYLNSLSDEDSKVYDYKIH